jgi:hypothetical protein
MPSHSPEAAEAKDEEEEEEVEAGAVAVAASLLAAEARGRRGRDFEERRGETSALPCRRSSNIAATLGALALASPLLLSLAARLTCFLLLLMHAAGRIFVATCEPRERERWKRRKQV